MTVVAASFMAVVYFVLTDIIASQGEFRFNLRAAAESYVVQNSWLCVDALDGLGWLPEPSRTPEKT